MKTTKEKIFYVFKNNKCIPNGMRLLYIISLCNDNYYRPKLINETEIIRRISKKELNRILPLIWQDKNIDHTRVVLLMQIYKGKDNTSDKIIKSLKIDQNIKNFYVSLYKKHMLKNFKIDMLNKFLNDDEKVQYDYLFDPNYGRIRI